MGRLCGAERKRRKKAKAELRLRQVEELEKAAAEGREPDPAIFMPIIIPNQVKKPKQPKIQEPAKPAVSSGAIDYIAEKMCINKKIFSSSSHASRVAASMSLRKSEKLVSYHCPFCGSFHVGHATK